MTNRMDDFKVEKKEINRMDDYTFSTPPSTVIEVPETPEEAGIKAKNSLDIAVDNELSVNEVESNYDIFDPSEPPITETPEEYAMSFTGTLKIPSVGMEEEVSIGSIRKYFELDKRKLKLPPAFKMPGYLGGRTGALSEALADKEQEDEYTHKQRVQALSDNDLQFVIEARRKNPKKIPIEIGEQAINEQKVRGAMKMIKSLPSSGESAFIILQRRTNLFNIPSFLSRHGIEELWGKYGQETAVAIEAAERVLQEKNQVDKFNWTRALDLPTGIGQTILEFSAMPDVTSKINAFSKLSTQAQRIISTSTRFAMKEALTLPEEGETVLGKGGKIVSSGGMGAALGGVNQYIPNPFLRVPTITGGFMGLTALGGGTADEIIETGVTVFGFQALGLIQKASVSRRARLGRLRMAKAIKAARQHNPDLKGVPDEAIGAALDQFKQIAFWQGELKKGRVTQSVATTRINEALDKIEPIARAIQRQSPTKPKGTGQKQFVSAQQAIETTLKVSPSAAKRAVDIATTEGVTKADRYLSAVKAVGEEAAEQVITEHAETSEKPAKKAEVDLKAKDEGDFINIDSVEAKPTGTGAGTEALQNLIDTTDKPIRLTVAKSNKKAQALYKKLGFKEITPEDPRITGIRMQLTPQQGEEGVTVWHKTTKDRAEGIRKTGFDMTKRGTGGQGGKTDIEGISFGSGTYGFSDEMLAHNLGVDASEIETIKTTIAPKKIFEANYGFQTEMGGPKKARQELLKQGYDAVRFPSGEIVVLDPSIIQLTPQQQGEGKSVAAKQAEPFEKMAKAANEKYKSLIGTRVTDSAGEWELSRFNQDGIPYFHKVKNGKVQKKEFTIQKYDRDWAEQQIKPKAVRQTEVNVEGLNVAKKGVTKQPWEMTQSEWFDENIGSDPTLVKGVPKDQRKSLKILGKKVLSKIGDIKDKSKIIPAVRDYYKKKYGLDFEVMTPSFIQWHAIRGRISNPEAAMHAISLEDIKHFNQFIPEGHQLKEYKDGLTPTAAKDYRVVEAYGPTVTFDAPVNDEAIGTLRHEIEHLIDNKNKYTGREDSSARKAEGFRDLSRFDRIKAIAKGHHEKYDAFDFQYTHRAMIREALEEGKAVPAEVLAAYPDLSPQQQGEEKKVKKSKVRAGFVDLTPIANAGQQIKTTTEKVTKGVTRFTGVEPEMKKVLIEMEEELKALPERKAKESIEIYGKLVEGQEDLIKAHIENPSKHPMPEGLEQYVEQVLTQNKQAKEIMEEIGYSADWPNQYRVWLQKKLQKAEAKEEVDEELVDSLKASIKEAEGLEYLHRQYKQLPLGERLRKWASRTITKKPKGVLGRKIPTREKAKKLGFEEVPLAVSQAHLMHEVEKAKVMNDLILAINDNPNLSLPEKQAPDDWVRIDERIFPASVKHQAYVEDGKPKHRKAYRKYPIPIAEALEELTYSKGNEAIENAYDKLNFGLKIIGFYNPLVMAKNDAVQLWRAAGVKGFAPLVLPQIKVGGGQIGINPPNAIKIWQEKGAEYQKLRKGGLFNNVVNYTPAVKEITDQMLKHIRETSGQKAARIIGEHLNPLNLLKNLSKYNNMSTWNIDEIIRIAAYEAVKDSSILKGMSDSEKIEWVNDAMVNYGKMPKSTKRWLSKGLFVPTYRIGNQRFFWGEVARVYDGQWRHAAPIVRTAGYKMFIKWGLPATIAAAILYKTGEERDVKTEKGYRLVIHNPETNTDTVYALSDPLLEGAKMTQRTLPHTIALNLAPIPSLVVRLSTGPRFKQSDDPFGEFFKLGTPIYRDILNWKDKDKTVPQKILTQMAIAFVYTRRGREQDKEKVITALAKTLSIWTDWKEQASSIKKIVSGRSYYLGPGGKFGRLFREYYVERDENYAEIDKELDSLIAKGKYKEAMRIGLDTDRYETIDGISNKVIAWRAPLYYYWQSMSKKDREVFGDWLRENKYYTEKEITGLIKALDEAKKDIKVDLEKAKKDIKVKQ